MSNYLLIESRDPFCSSAVHEHVALAAELARAGSAAALYLVQDGVLPARAGADNEAIHPALAAGIEVLADDYSLRERGLEADELVHGIEVASLDLVVERMAAGWKVLFC